jgi:deoxyribodipyrimidine photo-lyase
LDGAVSGLSPYLTHGFLSVPDVASVMYHRHRLGVQHRFIFELGWREYFQHLHQHLGTEGLAQSFSQGVLPDEAYSLELPQDVRAGCTGVPVVDNAVRLLYETGYLHNHARLWLASYVVHLRKVHWRVGADWLYSHLLDGDLASNYMSWQWVAGTLGEKPYLFNAESIEQFAPESWYSRGTALDTSYEVLDILANNPATVSQATMSELVWSEPEVLTKPLAEHGLGWPSSQEVEGREVWLVHPWHLADLPSDLPADAVVVAVVWREATQAHPWSKRRWDFVTQRMRELTPKCWFGTEAEIEQALSYAKRVHCVAHLRLPSLAGVAMQWRAAPRLFRDLEKLQNSFSKWWVQVNRNVRHLQQLVYPVTRRG